MQGKNYREEIGSIRDSYYPCMSLIYLDKEDCIHFVSDPVEKYLQQMVVNPRVLKSLSKEMAGMPASLSFIKIYESASTKDIFLSWAKRSNNAMAW